MNYFSVVYYFIYFFFVREKAAKEEEKILHSTFDTLNPIQERKSHDLLSHERNEVKSARSIHLSCEKKKKKKIINPTHLSISGFTSNSSLYSHRHTRRSFHHTHTHTHSTNLIKRNNVFCRAIFHRRRQSRREHQQEVFLQILLHRPMQRPKGGEIFFLATSRGRDCVVHVHARATGVGGV